MDRLIKIFRALGFTWCWTHPRVSDGYGLEKFRVLELPIFFIMGTSCSGKTTAGKLLQKSSGYSFVERSDLILAELESGGYRASIIRDFMNRGEHLPREFIISMLREHILMNYEHANGFIFCGFPVTLAELKLFELEIGRFNIIIFCSVPEEVYIERNFEKYEEPKKTAQHSIKRKIIQKYVDELTEYETVYRQYEHKTLKLFTNLPLKENFDSLLKDLHLYWDYSFELNDEII